MKLNKEREHLVLDNQKFVYYIVRKLGMTPKSSEYEDFVSVGEIGLIKAAITFDESRETAFITYASRCIENEIFMYHIKTSKYANDISIDEHINNKDKKSLTLGETIEDSNSNFIDDVLKKEEYIKMVSIVLNCLKGKQRVALLFFMGGVSQREISEKIGLSQSGVSKLQKRAIQKVRDIARKQKHYDEVFSMEIVGNKYKISFLPNMNRSFATFLQNFQSVENSADFEINCNEERIIIQTPAYPKSFYFIAQIIKENDEYNKIVTNKKVISEARQVRIYMLSIEDSFTFKDLKDRFPNLHDYTIRNVL